MFRKNSKTQRSPLLFEELEPRVLFSADGLGVLVDAADTPAAHVLVVDADLKVLTASENNVQRQGSDSAVQQRLELVFVDSNTPDYELLLADLLGQENENRRFEVIMLDASRDGIEQITNMLGQYSEVDAIHIVSHGDEGQVQLGNNSLSADNLNSYQSELRLWGSALEDSADILIYGCNLAATDAGQSLVNNLASLTSADVAASEDLTGHISMGGDWDLEYTTGAIETDIAFGSDVQQKWKSVLAGSWFDAGTGAPIGSSTAGNDIFVGDGSNDAGIDGWDGDDVLYGGDGDDNLTGGNGDDLILGGDGNDILNGGNFADILHGGRGDDIINGENNEDTLIGGGGNDTLNGGDEDDLFLFSGAQSGDFYTVDGGNHSDTIDVSAFDSAVDDGSLITVQLGGGDSFTISYTNVETIVEPGDPGNEAPAADAGPDQAVGTGALVTLDASASSDPDPESPTYSWQQISGPWVTLSSSTAEMPIFTAPGSAAVLEFALVASDASISDVDIVKITVGGPIDTSSLWLSTNGDAIDDNGAVSGQEEIVSFSDSSPRLELGDGDSGTTAGTFVSEHALAENVRALHYVNTAVTVDTLIGGMAGTYDLQPGQIVVSMRAGSPIDLPTLSMGILTVNNTDVVVYSPVSGEYELLLEDAIKKPDNTPANIHAISIVEQDTDIGVDTTLTAGTYLIARSDPAVHADISTYNNANGRQDLLLGGDFLSDSGEQIQGLELLEADLVVGGITVTEGTLLITVQSDGSQVVGTSGRTTVTAEQIDVIALTLNATEQDSGTADTNVDAQILFDGSDVGLSIESGTEVINGLTLAGNSLGNVNSEPTATNLTSTSFYNEGDGSVEISNIVVSDADAGEAITATLTLANTATGSLSSNNGATYTSGTGVWTITGTVANVNTALANLVFTPVGNNDQDTTIDVVIDDGDEDTSGPLTGTITLDVTPTSNGAVANFVPGAQNTDEDNSLIFSTANSNSITVDDGSAGDPILRTELSVTNGILTLNTAAGLVFENGADGTSSMTITGLESAINTALDGLTFTPTSNYDGPANLQITTDLPADLQGYYSFTQPGALGEDSSPGGANAGVPSGPGAAPDPYAVFDGDRGSDVLVLDGIDDNIMIAGRFSTPSNLTLAAWVNVSTADYQEVISIGGSIALRLNDVGFGDGVTGFFNDGSGWRHTDSNQFIGGDGWHHVAYTFDDASNTQIIYIDGIAQTTTSHTGTIDWTQQPDTTIGSHANQSSFWLDGMLDDARIYDRALGASEILALANDSASDAAVVSITVDPANDAPTATNLSSTSLYNEGDGNVAITDIVVSDVDAGDTITATLTLADTATGSLSADDGAIYTAGTGVWTITNTVVNVNTALKNLVFTPLVNNDVDTSIGVAIDDGDEDTSGPLIGTITLDVTPVNDAPTISVPSTVFINELHYENNGIDSGEAIELMGPAGTDLTGWSLVLYSSGNGNIVYRTEVLSGTIADQSNGFGTLEFNFPVDGIQNGGSDGIALVNSGSQVVQFISYEGVLTAVDGPAVGLTSTDIGVAEDGTTLVGDSLQLTGTGSEFTWMAAAANTFGMLNTGQSVFAVDNGIEDTDNVYTHAQILNLLGASDVDDDDADLTVIITNVVNGSLAMSGGTGELGTTFTFTPSAGFNGPLSFDYQIRDDESAVSAVGNGIINIAAPNNAPTATNLNTTSTYNEDDASVAITNIVVSDMDAGDTITATLTLANTATGSLSANNGATYIAGTGVWTITDTIVNVNAALANLVFIPLANNDQDTTIAVVIDDGDEDASGSLGGTISLDVTPANDPPTLALNNTVVLLAENTDTTTRIRVANIDIADDAMGSNVLSLAGNDATLFEIDSGVLYVKAGTLLNFEAQNRLNVTVLVNDPSVGSNPDDSAAHAISIDDINEAPALSFAGNDVDENTDTTGGYVVGVLSASDPDLGDLATFSVIGGADQDKFSISSGNELLLSDGQLDFENQASYEVTVRVTDAGNLQQSQAVTIIVNDVNEPILYSEGLETITLSAPTVNSFTQIVNEVNTVNAEIATTTTNASEQPSSTSDALPGRSVASEILAEEVFADEFATVEEGLLHDGLSDSLFFDTALIQSNNNFDAGVERPEKNVNLKQLVKAIANLNPASKLLVETATMLEDAFDFTALDNYSIINSDRFRHDLDDFRKELQAEASRGQTVVGSAVAASTGVSIGYVVWLVRGGVVLSSVLSSLPAWRLIDPLPVLATVLGSAEDEDDDESLASMLERDDPKHNEDQTSEDDQ